MNIVVTGAAKGIGNEIVRQLDATGEHYIVAISRDKAKLDKLNSETSSSTITLAVDLTSEELNKTCDVTFKEIDKVDVLINNAGQLINKPFLGTSSSDFVDLYKANVMSAVSIIQYLYFKLKNSTHAHVINISSMGGYQGSSKFPGLSAYSSSKGGLSTLTECLAEEFKDDHIFVNALALGAVKTEMLKKAFPTLDLGMEAEEMAKFIIDFALTGQQFFNGKILPVSASTP